MREALRWETGRREEWRRAGAVGLGLGGRATRRRGAAAMGRRRRAAAAGSKSLGARRRRRRLWRGAARHPQHLDPWRNGPRAAHPVVDGRPVHALEECEARGGRGGGAVCGGEDPWGAPARKVGVELSVEPAAVREGRVAADAHADNSAVEGRRRAGAGPGEGGQCGGGGRGRRGRRGPGGRRRGGGLHGLPLVLLVAPAHSPAAYRAVFVPVRALAGGGAVLAREAGAAPSRGGSGPTDVAEGGGRHRSLRRGGCSGATSGMWTRAAGDDWQVNPRGRRRELRGAVGKLRCQRSGEWAGVRGSAVLACSCSQPWRERVRGWDGTCTWPRIPHVGCERGGRVRCARGVAQKKMFAASSFSPLHPRAHDDG